MLKLEFGYSFGGGVESSLNGETHIVFIGVWWQGTYREDEGLRRVEGISTRVISIVGDGRGIIIKKRMIH